MSKRYKVLITGSSGMLGIDLCQELRGSFSVMGLDIIRNPKSKVSAYFKGDITDRKSVQVIIDKARPDFVVHAAAWADVDGCELDRTKAYRINSEGTRNIALACKKTDSVLIYISTDFVFNGKKRSPYRETDSVAPLSVYGDSKLKGETFVKTILNEYFILRTSWLYGSHGKNFVDTIVAKARTEGSLKVVRDQAGSPTYTKYLSRAIHALLSKGVGDGYTRKDFGVYHVSNSGRVSWYEYASRILKLVRSKTEVVPITSRQLARPAKRPAMSVMDHSKFVRLTGYRMPDWKIALKEYLSKK